MHLNRGLLFWGLAFASAGLVALAVQQGVLDRGTMAGAWRLWPLVLVAIGLSLVLSRTPYAVVGTVLSGLVIGVIAGTALAIGPALGISCGNGFSDTSLAKHSGAFSQTATLDWRLSCGTVDVTTSSGTTWTADVGSTRDPQPEVESGAGMLTIRTSGDTGTPWFEQRNERWEVELPTATTYDADIQANAGKMTLDLAGARFTRLAIQPNAAEVRVGLADAHVEGLDLQVNAGHAVITGSSATDLAGRIQVNAGSVDLCVPQSLGIRITSTGTLFGTNLDSSGLSRSGDTWESGSYSSADHTVTLEVQGNVGSFNLNPSGGC